MKKFILYLLFLPLPLLAQQLKIEPLYSLESTRREYPKPPNQVTKTFLGLSVLYGTPLFSWEFEIAQASYSDSFPATNSEVTSVTKRAMLGVRSYPITSQYWGWYLRAGVRAKQETLDIKENGVSRKEELPVYIDPYAGTGVTLALAGNFSLNGSATLVYNRSADVENESDRYDVQYTLSATIKVGNR